MSKLQTDRFGIVEYQDGNVIEFPSGLPGFEDEIRFLLVVNQTMEPLIFLQSMATSTLCFTAVPVQCVDPVYQLKVSVGDRKLLGWEREDPSPSRTDHLCLGILCANDGKEPTVNLLGPIVIDQRRKIGVQAVREDALYSAQHPLFPAERGDARCL